MSTFDDARDAAQQLTTACMHRDRDLAGQIFLEVPDHVALALPLVLADLVCHVHHRWASALGMTPDEARQAWVELLADIEDWRTAR